MLFKLTFWLAMKLSYDRFNDTISENQSAIFNIRSESSDGEKKSLSRLNLVDTRKFRQRMDWLILRLEKFNFFEKPPKIYLIYVQ